MAMECLEMQSRGSHHPPTLRPSGEVTSTALIGTTTWGRTTVRPAGMTSELAFTGLSRPGEEKKSSRPLRLGRGNFSHEDFKLK